jgi:hypothetical protein
MPLRAFSFQFGKEYDIRLYEFVIINHEFIKRAETRRTRDYPRDLDLLSQTLSSVRPSFTSHLSSIIGTVPFVSYEKSDFTS